MSDNKDKIFTLTADSGSLLKWSLSFLTASSRSAVSNSKESDTRSNVRNASLLVLQLSRQLINVNADVPVLEMCFLTKRSFFTGGW